jgi:hypothetical protein
MCGAIPPLPNTPSWHGAHLKQGTTLPLLNLKFLVCPEKWKERDCHFTCFLRENCIVTLTLIKFKFVCLTTW